jgi:hypothetical protein
MTWQGWVLLALGALFLVGAIAIGVLWFFARMMSDEPR